MTRLGRFLDHVERGVKGARRIDQTYLALRSPRRTLRALDAQMGEALGERRSPVGDRAAWLGTQLGSWIAHVGVIGSAVFVSGRSGRRRPVAYSIVAMSGTSAIYVGLKHSIRRDRPVRYDHLVVTRDPSFPSGHSASAAAAARSLAEIHGLPKLPLALASMIVPVTRVYLGVHHPSDVIAGWLLGWSWASLAATIVDPNADGPDVAPSTEAPAEPARSEPRPPEPEGDGLIDDDDDGAPAPESGVTRLPSRSERNHPSTG